MDESWRRRRPAIQPHQVADYLAPHDFRDVFGGPPRSVLLRHFSPSAQHANSRFRIMTREDNSPYNTVTTCKPEFVSTIRCGRNGFRVTKREVETANKTDFYKLGLASATSSRYGDNDGFQVKKKEENLPYGKVLHNLDLSATCSPHGTSEVMKRECSSIPVVHKRDDLSTVRDDHNDFRFMEREHDSLYHTKSNLYAPTTNYERNGSRVMKSEVDDMFSEDGVVYRPISDQHSMAWSGNNKFRALISEEGFYDDIFGSVSVDSNAGLRRSRSRSISKSESESTAVSCCEDGFLAANAGYGDEGDPALASFASKLRPITIPSKRYDSSSPSAISEGDSHNALRYAGPACPSSISHISERVAATNFNHPNTTNKSRCTASSFCCFTPPETLSLDPSFRMSFKKPASPEDNSPPSFISLPVPYKVKKVEKKVVSEITDNVKTEEQNFGLEVSAALDEAIAWAKERFMKPDDTIEGKSEDFVNLKDWNATKEKYSADCKER